MEELDIKEIWQTQKLSTPELEESELEQMLRKRSQSIVDKLKKLTRIEHTTNIVVSVVLIGFFFILGDYTYGVILSVVMVAAIIYYKKMYDKLHAIQPASDVRQYLETIHKELNDFVRKYQISISVILTVAYGLGLYLGISARPLSEREFGLKFYLWVIGTYLVSLAACFLIVFLFYGSKAKKVKIMLDELEEA